MRTTASSDTQAHTLVRGVLQVSKHASTFEAHISVNTAELSVSTSASRAVQKVLVLGAVHRNRAMHGDQVAVQVLPEAMWQCSLSTKRLLQRGDAISGQADAASSADASAEALGQLLSTTELQPEPTGVLLLPAPVHPPRLLDRASRARRVP